MASPGVADTLVHVNAPIFGCQKPRAAKAINNLDDPRHSDPRWIAYVMGDGRCVKITPQSPWTAAGSDNNGLTLLSYSGTVGKRASFYVPTGSIDFASEAAQPTAQDNLATPSVPQAAPPDAASSAAPPAPPPGPLHGDPDQPADSVLTDGAQTSPSAPLVQPPAIQSDTSASPLPGPQTNLPPPPPLDNQKLAEMRTQVDEAGKGGPGFLFPLLALVFVGGVVVAVFAFSHRTKRAAEAHLYELVGREISHNTRPLRVKRMHTVQRDEFGTVKWDKWFAAMEYYYSTRIAPILSAEGYQAPPVGFVEAAHRMIEAAATSAPAAGEPADDLVEQYVSSPDTFDTRMHPIDYESFCAIQLQKAGWDTRTTVATGDQGADVIATQSGKVLVVQCKLYSSSIGNDAVQQVLSAKTFQGAQFAAVASNQPYTRSARQLASVSGVVLLHHDELQTLHLADLQRRKMAV